MTTATVGQYTFEEYLELISDFHSYPAPGLIIGGFMVELAKHHMPEGVLYDAISEAASCLPDAIQLLTPCTAGNGWLRIINLDRYALSLFNKYTGEGVRVHLDVHKLDAYPNIREWYLKLKTKQEQDSDALRAEMRAAGESVLTVTPVQVAPQHVGKSSKGPITVCPLCGEAFPKAHGPACKGCQGANPYVAGQTPDLPVPQLTSVPVEEAVGQTALHDMTRIEPGKSKGPAFKAGQRLSVGDVCRLQQMGRMNVYVRENADEGAEFVHEDDAARELAQAMCPQDGSVVAAGPAREGKVSLLAGPDGPGGLLVVDDERLVALNLLPEVMAASLTPYSLVAPGQEVAGTRALPLYLPRATLNAALELLSQGPLMAIKPLRRAKAGLLITGTEVVQGLIQDKFEPTLRPKLEKLGCTVQGVVTVPDDAEAIATGARELVDAGCDLILTTAGLSVDPDDVTRQGLESAGAADLLHGAPMLPGSMVLLGRLGNAQLLGVPACALFHPTTAVDVLLPRLLAGLAPTRADLAKLAPGGLCKDCQECAFPHCPFGG